LAGAGGSKRTSCLMELVSKGAKFIADDVCIVTSKGYVVSSGPKIVLRCETGIRGLKDNFESISPKRGLLTPSQMLQRHVMRIAEKVLAGRSNRYSSALKRRIQRRMGFSVEADARKLWSEEDLVEFCSLDKVILQSPSTLEHQVKRIDPEDMAQRLLMINRLELKGYLELLQIFSFASPWRARSLVDGYKRFEEVVSSAIAKAECFHVKGSDEFIRKQALRLSRGDLKSAGGRKT